MDIGKSAEHFRGQKDMSENGAVGVFSLGTVTQ